MKTIMRLTTLAALALALALPAAAQSYDWSSVGSYGNYSQGSFFNAIAAGPTLKFRSTSNGTIVKQYLVTNTYGSATSLLPGWTNLHAAFTDDSANGSVTVKLFKVDKCSDAVTQLCTISSSDAAGVQCQTCQFNNGDIDFGNFSYWVEVTLTRSATSANEQIHSVALN
jgi:hypothetical protein